MNEKVFELQKIISQFLLLKIDSNEISLDRASEISKIVLSLLTEKVSSDEFEQVYLNIKLIPELSEVLSNLYE